MLREGLRATPSAVALREALGLALVRLGRKHEALAEFAAAYKAAPGQARGAHVYPSRWPMPGAGPKRCGCWATRRGKAAIATCSSRSRRKAAATEATT